MTQTVYFGASNGTQGTELWKVDELGNLSLAADIYPGGGSSGPSQFVAYNGELYFIATPALLKFELWKIAADGTVRPVHSVATGATVAGAQHLTMANGRLYFIAQGPNGLEPYVIGPDGVVQLVADIDPAGDSHADDFTAVGDEVYFTAYTASGGKELWRIAPDGTVTMVPEINAGVQSSAAGNLVSFGGTLYFSGYKTTVGYDLFKLRPDGTPVIARDINPHSASSQPQGFTIFNGEMYFRAIGPNDGFELWKVKADGSVVQVADLNPGVDGSTPHEFTEFNGSLYFAAKGPGGATELWRIAPDGSLLPVASINPTAGSNPNNLTVFNGALYFVADDGTHGAELWRIEADGAVSLVADLNPGPDGSSPISLTATDDALYFSADTPASGREVWRLEPGDVLTQVTDLVPGPGSSHISPFFIGVHETAAPLVAPMIISNGGGTSASISIGENKTVVTTVVATDDSLGVHFALSGADAGRFSISSAGQLRFKSAPDFEAPSDKGLNNVYEVTVAAIDQDGLTDSQALSIAVTDVKGIAYAGTSGSNKKVGTLEADTLRGKGGNDTLKGSGGNDTVSGGAGNDKLFGGEGNDKLTGGSGKDYFVFDVALASTGIDKVTDFRHADDTIRLENTVFTALGASVSSNEFVARSSGHAATKPSHHLIYDKSNGSLWYDADGKAAGAAVKIAQLGTTASHPMNIAYDDFAII